MSDIKRREMLQMLGGAPAAALAFTWTAADVTLAAAGAQQARADAAAAQQSYTPRFFTPREFTMITVLGDMIIPKDARSGSASDAGTPAFIDYIVAEQPERKTAMRGGLAWLDSECQRRFDKPFLDSTEAQRKLVLDDVAWPKKALPSLSHGVQFFNTMRDLVAAGFWSSQMGVADLGYTGNRPTVWDGAPPEVLTKLGVRYE